LRPKVYVYMAAQASKPLYIKIHDAYTFLADGRPLIPTSGCNGAIYIIRNPLDTAVSLAFHLGCDVDTAIEHMNNPNYCFSGSTRHLHIKLKQSLMTWSGHVESWTNGPEFPVKVIRYEDMHAKPLETFTMAAAFAGFPAGSKEIQQAIAGADFKTLKQQEECAGFREKPANMAAFFREGKVGSYRNVLTPAQISLIVRNHATVMRRFGYLGEQDEILF
jgi:aryl sulfotransferase